MAKFRDEIRLRDLRIHTQIGALPGEADQPQPLRVDLSVVADLEAAAASDDLGQTVDYRFLVEAVRRVSDDRRHQLLESLARLILVEVTADARVLEAEVSVEKERLPLGPEAGPIVVRLRRTREELH